MAAKKECQAVDLSATVAYTETSAPGDCCGSTPSPWGWRIYGNEAARVILKSPAVLHVRIADTAIVPAAGLCVDLRRQVDCGGCCTPEYFSSDVAWHGDGTVLMPGVYELSIPEQAAYMKYFPDMQSETFDVTVSFLFEPMDIDYAILYTLSKRGY